MSRAFISKHYARILSTWPKDLLRPEISFQKSLQYRITSTSKIQESSQPPASEIRNINALYSLLDDRYMKKYPVPPELLRPAFNPTYYDDLVAQVGIAPTKTWWQNVVSRWKGMVRFS